MLQILLRRVPPSNNGPTVPIKVNKNWLNAFIIFFFVHNNHYHPVVKFETSSERNKQNNLRTKNNTSVGILSHATQMS